MSNLQALSHRPTKTVATQLSHAIFSVYLVLAFLVTLVQISIEVVHEKQSLSAHIDSLSSAFQASAAEALWNYDERQLNATLEGLHSNAEVFGVMIEGELTKRYSKGTTVDSSPLDVLYSSEYPLISPGDPSEALGKLTIFYSSVTVFEQVYMTVLVTVVVAIIKTIGLWCIVVFFINRLVKQPVSQLQARINNFDIEQTLPDALSPSDELDQDINEIGYLDRCFTTLCSELLSKKTALDEHTNKLMCMVSDATQELRESKIAAEQKATAVADFLANMSHEIRTPMNAIINFSHLALRTELSVQQADYIKKVHRTGATLLDIINDVLDFSKVEAGKLTLENAKFSLYETLEHSVDLISVPAARKNIELLIYIDPGIPEYVMGDSLRLGQVLTNLASNAVKFTQHGEIIFELRLLDSDQESVTLGFSVTDSGIGLTQEQIRDLFQAFTQADSSISRQFGGTGLGLAISSKLVSLMGGELTASGQPKMGATFSFTVALTRVSTEPVTVKCDQLHGLHILVIDAHTRSRCLLTEMLESRGVITTSVVSIEAAKSTFCRLSKNSTVFDLVLLSVDRLQLPNEDSINRIQKQIGLTSTPVVFMLSPYDKDRQWYLDSMRLNHPFMVTKPVMPHNLCAVIGVATHRSAVPVESDSSIRSDSSKPCSSKHDKPRVLVVDDNIVNRMVARELLASVGVSVEEAEDAARAIEMVGNCTNANKYDVILMDLRMPGMDGFEATQVLLNQYGYLNIPVIALTAEVVQEELDKCKACGMQDYISKPINPKKMFDVLSGYVGRDLHY